MGPKSGEFDHLHRFRMDWKGKFGSGVKLTFRQDVEVGIKDFKTSIPAIDEGVPSELPDAPEIESEASSDAGEAGAEEGSTDGPASGEPGADETGTDETGTDETGTDETGTDETGADETGSDETAADETGTDETGTGELQTDDTAGGGSAEEELIELPSEEQLDAKLSQIEKIFTVKSETALGMDFEITKTSTVGFDAGFTRTGAIDDVAKKSYPEKLTPAVALRGAFKLGKSDKLLPKLKYDYSTFSTSSTSMLGAATLGWKHALYKGATLGLAAGVAIASFETKTVAQAFITPVSTLDLGFEWKPKGHKIDLKVGTALQPYASSGTGVVVPRVSGTLGVGWKSKGGLYVKSSTSLVSSLMPQDYDPQGYTLLIDGKLGYALSPYFSVELGTQFTRNQKPDRGTKTFEPDDRLEVFLMLTGSSGFLP